MSPLQLTILITLAGATAVSVAMVVLEVRRAASFRRWLNRVPRGGHDGLFEKPLDTNKNN